MTNASKPQQCTTFPSPSVRLGPVTDQDYELISRWMESKSGIYAGGAGHYLNADGVRKLMEGGRDNFLMVRDRDGRAIGAVIWRTGQYAASFEIGTMIGDATRWQIGFGCEAVMALIGMLFDTRNAHRVEFICGVFNKPAIQLCCSGMIQVEGILRDYFYFDGIYHDAIIGSILREEYYALFRPGQTVPGEEIDEARRILDDYLAKNPIVLRKL